MVDKEKLAKYLQELEQYIKKLEELQGHPKEEILADWKVYDLVDRNLHLAIETFLTLGEMLIGEKNLPKPNTYADVPRILAQEKLIHTELSEKLVDLAKFRNVLVHDYLYLDHERVYEHLQKDVEILQEFLEVMVQLIRKEEEK